MDAMKYSMEADKYRSAYMPPSSLAMSMYSDPKYLDSTAKSYLDRGYLDSTSALTKAYFENSKMYMDGKGYSDQRGSPGYPMDGKMYESSNGSRTPPAADSPEVNIKSERPETSASSSASSTSTSASASSPGSLPSYYTQQTHMPPGLIPMSQMSQYSQHYHQAASGGSEFRRPLTVIF